MEQSIGSYLPFVTPVASTEFRPARPVRLYEDVAHQLREAILSGRYQPGDRLPLERELMATFGVSRAVVRQATMSLEHEGLVEVQVGASGGTFALQSGTDPMIRAFETLLRHRQVSVSDYLTAKRLLEPVLASAVFAGAGEEEFERLAANLVDSRRAVAEGRADDELLQLCLDFHELLVAATRSPVLEALFIALVRMGQRVPAFTSPARTDWKHILAEHDHILAALRAGNEEQFSQLLLSHLELVDQIYGEGETQPSSPSDGAGRSQP